MTISGVGGSHSQQPSFDASRKVAAARITKMVQNLGNLLTNFKVLVDKLRNEGIESGLVDTATMMADGGKLLDQIETIQKELSSLHAGGELKYAMGEKKANAFMIKTANGLGNAGVSIRDALDTFKRTPVGTGISATILVNLAEASSALNDIIKVSYS